MTCLALALLPSLGGSEGWPARAANLAGCGGRWGIWRSSELDSNICEVSRQIELNSPFPKMWQCWRVRRTRRAWTLLWSCHSDIRKPVLRGGLLVSTSWVPLAPIKCHWSFTLSSPALEQIFQGGYHSNLTCRKRKLLIFLTRSPFFRQHIWGLEFNEWSNSDHRFLWGKRMKSHNMYWLFPENGCSARITNSLFPSSSLRDVS